MPQLREAEVRMNGELIGTLREIAGGWTEFEYLPEWLTRRDARSVSLTLPLRVEPFVSKGLHPFFENLLRPNWVLSLIARNNDELDPFGLLLATGEDCIGAVEVVPPSQTTHLYG
jgi:HipA-like protein